MAKRSLKPSTIMQPLPAVLVSCGDIDNQSNIITISWIGIVCSVPPMLSISVRKNRHSFQFIKQSGEFAVNFVGHELVEAVDFCGSKSGRDVEKFSACNLTSTRSEKIKSPLIAEAPVSHECVVEQTLNLGSHHIFIAEIVATHIDDKLFDENNRIDIKKFNPISYSQHARTYWSGLSQIHDLKQK